MTVRDASIEMEPAFDAGAESDLPEDFSILFMNPSGQLGGAERSLLDVMAEIRDRFPGWRMGLVATADGPLVPHARSLGVETTVLKLPRLISSLGDAGLDRKGLLKRSIQLVVALPAAVAYAFGLARVVRRFAPDLIHTNGFKMHILGSWARPRGTPVVWHVHDFVRRRKVMSRLLRAHAGRCAVVVANSRSVREDVESVVPEGLPARLVYNAVDLDRFSPDGPALDLDALAGVPPASEGTVRVGLVATLGWWKGHETFLRALALIPREVQVRGYIIGGALYETRGSQHTIRGLRAAAGRFGVAHRVAFTGFIEDAASAIRALDVLAHASTEPEAFGLVIIEGMATGLPVIASNSGGAAELVTEGVNGLLHTPGNEFELAASIEKLARDAELRRRLGREGRRTAETRFRRERLLDDLLPAYVEACQRVSP